MFIYSTIERNLFTQLRAPSGVEAPERREPKKHFPYTVVRDDRKKKNK